MKNVFDVILMIWIGLIFMFCMVTFSEEVFIRQQTIHLRNKMNEILEINGGYTQQADQEINSLFSKSKYSYEFQISKKGKLNYGEKVEYKIILHYKRKLPFNIDTEDIEHSIMGEYYNSSY